MFREKKWEWGAVHLSLQSAICGPAWCCRAIAIGKTAMIRFLVRLCLFWSLALVWVGALSAASIDVVVVDRAGSPVPDVVVLAESKTEKPLTHDLGQQPSFEIDQQNLMFDPHILVVPVGASVRFLNSDPTAHHVYSFSKVKRFTLPLYKGKVPDPIVFQTPGIVTLGCNIHDHMVAYIVVAESHLYTQTDAEGRAKLTIDDDIGDVQIRIWSPRIRDKRNLLVRDVSVDEPVRFSLKKKLKPAIEHHSTDSSEWSEY